MQTGPESDFLGAGTGQERQHGAPQGAPEKMLPPLQSVEFHTDDEQAWENGFAKCSVGKEVY